MNNLERPRRVVLDVLNDQLGNRDHVGGDPDKRPRRRRRRKTQQGRNNFTLSASPQANPHDEDDDTITVQQEPIPMELWPTIQNILGYGKKTHALGAMKAASTLSDIASRLRALGPPTPALEKIMMDAERESNELRALFHQTYEE